MFDKSRKFQIDLFDYHVAIAIAKEDLVKEIDKELKAESYQLPVIFPSGCDAFAIEWANNFWCQYEKRIVLKNLSRSRCPFQLLVMLMRKMPQRILENHAAYRDKLPVNTNRYFINFMAYCTLVDYDYERIENLINKAVDWVLEENRQEHLTILDIDDVSLINIINPYSRGRVYHPYLHGVEHITRVVPIDFPVYQYSGYMLISQGALVISIPPEILLDAEAKGIKCSTLLATGSFSPEKPI